VVMVGAVLLTGVDFPVAEDHLPGCRCAGYCYRGKTEAWEGGKRLGGMGQ
jgi:hypothetical protein